MTLHGSLGRVPALVPLLHQRRLHLIDPLASKGERERKGEREGGREGEQP